MSFDLLTIDFKDEKAPKLLHHSLKSTGFAMFENFPIDQDLIDQGYQVWRDFFNSDEKYDYAFDNVFHDGFVSKELSETAKGSNIKDIKEFYHFYLNGRCPESVKEVTLALFAQMNAFGETLLAWIEQEMPLELRESLSMSLSEMIENSPKTLFRPIHYPPMRGDEPVGAVRAAAHEDINLITILPSATARGLQVLDMNDVWHTVETNPNRIVINTGDMLAECTAGYYRATKHQVVKPEGEDAKQSRLAMPMFIHPRGDVRLSDRHTAESYRLERYGELGLAPKGNY